jgi:hypothetical protein
MALWMARPHIEQPAWLDDDDDWLADDRDRASDVAGVLQAKLNAIADATRNGKSGTARMVFRMTGRS